MTRLYGEEEIISNLFNYFLTIHSVLQITIGNQQVTLNALQVVTLAIKYFTSGNSINGNKPFAAFSGNMCGRVYGSDDVCNYVMVSRSIVQI